MTNVIVANLAKSRFYRASPVYQYNYGMMLKITGVELPTAYEVDFANDINGQSITQIGGADGVSIPSQFFTPGQAIYCWLRVHPTQDSGITTATIVIPISPRAVITDDEPTPEEQSAIDEAIAALNDAVDKVEDAVEHYPTITGGIWYVWDVDAGEYVSTGIPAQGAQGNPGTDGHDGTDGFSPTAIVTQTQTGATISITDKQGTTTANISNGQDGAPGQPGTDGTDGVSPTVTVTDITGGHRITITDATGAHSFDVMDGQDGQGAVQDVQVAGTSVVQDGVANVPVASGSAFGAVKVNNNGVWLVNGEIRTNAASIAQIKAGVNSYNVIAPINQDQSIFYGLAKAAGSDEKNSTLPVGQYTDAAKSAIQKMLGVGSQFELIRFIELTEDTQYIIIDTDDNSESFSLQGFLIAINSVGASDASAEAHLKVTVNSLYAYSNIIMDMPSGIRKANSERGVALYGASCGGIAHFSATMFRDNVNFVDENGNLIMSGMSMQTNGIVQTGFTNYGTITTFLVGSNASPNKLGAGTRIAVYGHRV